MQTNKKMVLAASVLALSGIACGDITVDMQAVSDTGSGESVGVVVISEAAHGLVFTPELRDLPPGPHGFHIHENPSCEAALDDEGKSVAALGAGGHYDSTPGSEHGSPLTEGHRGDLPVLSVDETGQAGTAVNSARLNLEEVRNRALMIHMGGDNHSDSPEPLGGGGARIACGVIL